MSYFCFRDDILEHVSHKLADPIFLVIWAFLIALAVKKDQELSRNKINIARRFLEKEVVLNSDEILFAPLLLMENFDPRVLRNISVLDSRSADYVKIRWSDITRWFVYGETHDETPIGRVSNECVYRIEFNMMSVEIAREPFFGQESRFLDLVSQQIKVPIEIVDAEIR